MKHHILNAVNAGKRKVVVASAIAVAAVSPAAFADNTQAITDAVAAGTGMVSLTTSGVISLAALGFGLGMVVSWLRK